MTHIGILCPSALGHLNPMCTLGRELQRRGHQVTLLGTPDVQAKVRNTGLDYVVIGEQDFPLGTLDQIYETLGQKSGLSALNYTIDWMKQEIQMFVKEAPSVLQSLAVKALLIDQVTIIGGTVAEYLNLPFITVCNALLINQEAAVPPFITHWVYSQSWWRILRNQMGNAFVRHLTKSARDVVIRQREQWNLAPYRHDNDYYSPLAQICQLPENYDYPRTRLPQWFHYTGPLQDPSGLEPVSFPSISFPFEQLTDQPLIYASLGTLQNRIPEIFRDIALSCVGLEAQLVISLGNPDLDEVEMHLPGDPIVVPFAPHQQLIQRASLVITHAGMNTTLGALSAGVPLVAVPITNEQPGIASRIAWAGAGQVVPFPQLTVANLKAAIATVLTENTYKQNAMRLQRAIKRAGGVQHAADIVEQALSTRKPVLRGAVIGQQSKSSHGDED